MKTTATVLAAVLALIQTLPGQAADKKSPQQIIDRAIKAFGGIEALQKQRISVSKDEGTFHGMGDAIPYQGEFKTSFPDKMRVEILNVFVIVTNGNKTWVSSMGQTLELPEEAAKEQRRQMHTGYVTSLIPLAKPNDKYKLSSFGEEEVNGETCDGINVESKGQRKVTLFFSRKSGMLTKAAYIVFSDEEQKEVNEDVVMSDFRKVDGVNTAFKVVINRDGKVYVKSNVKEVSFPMEADESWFKKPE